LPKKKRGFTLIEMLIAGVCVGLLMPTIGAAVYMNMTVPEQEGNELTAIHQTHYVSDWVILDGMRAREFSPGTNPIYGTFYWEDYTVEAVYYYEAGYRWEDGKLIRDETVKLWESDELIIDSESEITIARHIEKYNDVEFQDYSSHLEVRVNSVKGDQSKELIIQVKPRILLTEEEE